MGIKRENISRWENEAAEPSRENLIKLADHFGVTTDFLLGRESQPTKRPQNKPEAGVDADDEPSSETE